VKELHVNGIAIATTTLAPPRRSLAADVAGVLLASAALAVSARIKFPLLPVPVTAQTLAVLLAGALLGPRRGTLSVLNYLAIGAMGAPVFAMGAGLPYMMGPTGGYLVGFIPAAWLAGVLVPRWANRPGGLLAALAIPTAVIFAFGLAWLSVFVPTSRLLMAGLIPFLPGAVLKIAVAALVIRVHRQ